MGNLSDLGFDSRKVEAKQPGDKAPPIPEGAYQVAVSSTDLRNNKSNTGQLLEVKFAVIQGEYQGRTLATWLNIRHASAQTQTIAQAQLSALCRACGIVTLDDTSDFVNKTLVVKVSVRKRADTGDMTNNIDEFHPLTALASPSNTGTVGTGAGGPPPWMAKK
jgi:hypothetical protein